jgi:DNA-binding NarL/FixJ family response regulator
MHKALIIEDNQTFLKTFKEAMCKRFPEIKIEDAADGKQAFDKIDAFQPDIIFMDIRLPGESGLELTIKIKSKYPGIRIVILTDYDLPEYREAAKKGGADGYIHKGSFNLSNISQLFQSYWGQNR